MKLKAPEASSPLHILRNEIKLYRQSQSQRKMRTGKETVCTAAATVLKCRLTDFETVVEDDESLNLFSLHGVL